MHSGSRTAAARTALIVCAVFATTTPGEAGPEASPYLVEKLTLTYARPLPEYPDLATVAEKVEVPLIRVDGGYAAPTEDSEPTPVAVSTLTRRGPHRLSRSALDAVAVALERYLGAPSDLPEGKVRLVGPVATVHAGDIDPETHREPPRGKGKASRVRIVIAEEGRTYPVARFDIDSRGDPTGLPPVEKLSKLSVRLARARGRYVAPRPGVPAVRVRLGAPRDKPARFSGSAVAAVNRAILTHLRNRGLAGLYVTVHRDDIDPRTGADLRDEDRNDLRIRVVVARVSELRTVASGDRIAAEPEDARTDHAAHAWIRTGSPVRPAAEDGSDGSDVIRKGKLDRYVYFLNRHPGRRVDVRVLGGDEPTELEMEYVVAESKPWRAFYQLSNTGTEETGECRQRFGFWTNQLIGRDDLFQIDYVTSTFNDIHSVSGHYESPLFWKLRRLRGRLTWLYSEYDSSQFDIPGASFSGAECSVGGELAWNVFQHRDLFLDAVGGLQYRRITTDNQLAGVRGEGHLLGFKAGLRAERHRETSALSAEAFFETNCPGIGTSGDELAALGRADVDASWTVFRWSAYASTFLEPLLDPGFAAGGGAATTPLVHEATVTFRGQHACGDRLIPQAQEVIGGFYSVRGYPQSVASGDNGYVASAEYRFHLPRAFELQEGNEFNVFGRPFVVFPRAGQPFSRPDWDLILRAFVDGGEAWSNAPLSFEGHHRLLSWGLGAELQVMQHLNLRCDWGMALHDVKPEVDAGDNEFHLSLTLSW